MIRRIKATGIVAVFAIGFLSFLIPGSTADFSASGQGSIRITVAVPVAAPVVSSEATVALQAPNPIAIDEQPVAEPQPVIEEQPVVDPQPVPAPELPDNPPAEEVVEPVVPAQPEPVPAQPEPSPAPVEPPVEPTAPEVVPVAPTDPSE